MHLTPEDPEDERFWADAIVQLQIFTRSLVKRKPWFRGFKTSVFLAGKEIDDYVIEAIERYLRSPEKFKPEKGSLINYLKFNLIRSIVHGDAISDENKKTNNPSPPPQTDNDEEDGSYLDKMMPRVEALFGEQLDYERIMECIEEATKDDVIVENIFLGLSIYDMKRREIIAEFNMSERDYDNGMKRLKTILNNVAQKFDIKSTKQ